MFLRKRHDMSKNSNSILSTKRGVIDLTLMDQFQIPYFVFLITSKHTEYDLKKYEKVSISNYSEKKNILLTHMDINFL